ncbi:MAG: adaptor protein MecA [Eubacteriales bacterium]
MELVLISDNKLKIILTDEDMSTLDISCDTIDYDNTSTRRAFWELLDKAKQQTGFDAASDKVLVQVYPDKNGGCSMYVTKMTGIKNEPYDYEKKYKTRLYTTAKEKKSRIIFRFPDSEALCSACKQLALHGYEGDSDVYASRRSYYLYIEDTKPSRVPLVSEYATLVHNPFFAYYLTEHSKHICKGNAVDVFGSLYE